MGFSFSRSENRQISVENDMNEKIASFFEKEVRYIFNKNFDDWSVGDKRTVINLFGMKNSSFSSKFLRMLNTQFLVNLIKENEVNEFDSNDVVFKYDNQMHLIDIDEKEDNNFALFLQTIWNHTIKNGKKKIDFGLVILTLKMQIFIERVIKMKKVQYGNLLEKNLFVDEGFLLKMCKMQVVPEGIAKNDLLRVFYIVTDSVGNESLIEKIRKSLLVNGKILSFLELIRNQKQFEYGIFHPCVKLGPEYLEWDTGSLIVAQNYDESWSSSHAKACFSVCTVHISPEQAKVLCTELNKILLKWNKYVIYSQGNSLCYEEGFWGGFGNCHQFFTSIRECLFKNVPGFEEPEVIKNIFKEIKHQTKFQIDSIYRHGLTKKFQELLFQEIEFKEVFKQIKTSVTHREYDMHCSQLYKMFYKKFKVPFDQNSEFFQDYTLFKAFDRGFWMKRQKAEKKFIAFSKKEKTEKEKRDRKKLLMSKKFIDLDYDCEKECPFGNPKKSKNFTLETTPKN